MSAREAKCFSSALDLLKQPPAYFGSAAFSQKRWTLAGDQRDERMRVFTRKLLRRLDGMDIPFYPAVGLMDHKTAQQRYVMGIDPWSPMASPFLDGIAVEFRHCVAESLAPRCWALFAEVGFDVARLAQIPVAWGGFSSLKRYGMWMIHDVHDHDWAVDRRTYGVKTKGEIEYSLS